MQMIFLRMSAPFLLFQLCFGRKRGNVNTANSSNFSLGGSDGEIFAALLEHKYFKQTDLFGRIADDFGCALADDALVSIAVIDGFFGAYEGVTIVEFKGYAGILAQHVDFAPLVG